MPTIGFFLAFQAPTLAMAFVQTSKMLRHLLLLCLGVLLLFDFSALGSGGDFKGCSACDGPFLLHLVFAVLVLPVSFVCLVVLRMRKQPTNAF
jgi:hypothetical protein